MRAFTEKVISQVYDLYDGNFTNDNKELIMALFMQMFSYKFDDRVDNTIKFKDIDSIIKTVWKPIVYDKHNDKIGIPDFFNKNDRNEFYAFDIQKKTEYLLEHIRNAIVHDDFRINNDGTVTIVGRKEQIKNNQKNYVKVFQMTFEFECIVDICFIIQKELGITEQHVKHLYDFLLYVKDLKNHDDEYNKAKLEFNFLDLKYIVILFNLLPRHDKDLDIDRDHIDFIIKLFNDKRFFVSGRLKDDQPLKEDDLSKLRNCITHGDYTYSHDDLTLYDLYKF